MNTSRVLLLPASIASIEYSAASSRSFSKSIMVSLTMQRWSENYGTILAGCQLANQTVRVFHSGEEGTVVLMSLGSSCSSARHGFGCSGFRARPSNIRKIIHETDSADR